MLMPGMRVEALKSGTQGTWYVARIVEFATFPAYYIDGDNGENDPQQNYPMVCVHYEGPIPAKSECDSDSRIFSIAVNLDSTIIITANVC